MYAQITDNTITATRSTLPDKARRLDTDDVVIGFPTADTDTHIACGWFEVIETLPPNYDPATQTRASTIEIVDGVPTQVWTITDLSTVELEKKVRSEADDLERDQIRRMVDWLTLVIQDNRQSVENQRFARILKMLIRDQYGDVE